MHLYEMSMNMTEEQLYESSTHMDKSASIVLAYAGIQPSTMVIKRQHTGTAYVAMMRSRKAWDSATFTDSTNAGHRLYNWSMRS